MGSINRSHNEADGGILLFNGELILLYCDSVQCEVGGKESIKGRVYLTTHRLVMIVTPYRQNSAVKSLCAPFCAILKCNVEQPIFGANYIEATVRDESDPTKTFSFKLRFSKGGAIEFAMAMNRAVVAVGRNINPSMQPPPAYTPAPSAQYYQAPPTVYAPGYNCGVQMPVQQFPDQPPIGFIYASSAPPPYPGLGGFGQVGGQAGGQAPPPYTQPQQQGGQAGGYPSTTGSGSGYPAHQNQPATGYPQAGNQGSQQVAPAGYPQLPSGYPQQPSGYPQQPSGYPQQPSGNPQQPSGNPQQQHQQTPPGYHQQPAGYPQQPSGYPQQQPPSAGYPDLSQVGPPAAPPQQSSTVAQPQTSEASSTNPNVWPSAPAFNPNWQDDKKSA